MVAEFLVQRAGVEPQGIDRGLALQRSLRALTDPARECNLRGGDAAIELAGTIIQSGQYAMRCKDVSLAAPACTVGTLAGDDLELDLPGLLGNHRRHGLGVVAVQPRERRVALDGRDERGLFRQGFLRFAFEALCAQLALFRKREFLHDPDAAL